MGIYPYQHPMGGTLVGIYLSTPHGRHPGGYYPIYTMGGTLVGIYTRVYTTVHIGRHTPGYTPPYTHREAYTRMYTTVHTQGGIDPGYTSRGSREPLMSGLYLRRLSGASLDR